MADIGSDHGYATIYALENGLTDRVIATDISKLSLAKTEKLVAEAGLADKVNCRVGDGFTVLKEGEADVAFVAGMGADLIADIVIQSEAVSKSFSSMVLQPMNPAERLRIKLSENGYEITKEAVVFENRKWYSILKVRSGSKKELTEAEAFIGTFVFKDKIPLAEEYILSLQRHYERIIGYVGNNATLSAENGINNAKERLCIIKEALEWVRS